HHVAGAEPQLGRVVDAAPRGQVVIQVVPAERGDVADLLAHGIDHHQLVAGLQLHRVARTRRDAYRHPASAHLGLRTWNGQVQSASTLRPLYWRVSAAVPKSARFGLMLPCRAMSRWRVAACILA